MASKLARFKSSWYQNVGNIARDGVQNTYQWSEAVSDVTDKWLLQWRHDTARPTPFLVAGSVHPDHLCVDTIFYTFCCNIPGMLQSSGFKSGEFGGPQFRWDKFWSFCYNSMVARVRRAFQVSQGSVETLFRWGGKRLKDFAANLFRIDWLIDWVRLNVPPTQYRSYGDGFLRVKWPNQQCQSTEGTNLFRKRCTKFRQNRSSFFRRYYKNILVTFFWTPHCIPVVDNCVH